MPGTVTLSKVLLPTCPIARQTLLLSEHAEHPWMVRLAGVVLLLLARCVSLQRGQIICTPGCLAKASRDDSKQMLVVNLLDSNRLCISSRVSGSRSNAFLRFKTTAKDGLLLWRGDSPMRPNSDFISLGLRDGALVFR